MPLGRPNMRLMSLRAQVKGLILDASLLLSAYMKAALGYPSRTVKKGLGQQFI
jgi:hypothetical protein